MNILFVDAIASWNIFIKHFDNLPSFDTLKAHPKLGLVKIHDPIGIRYLFQLRVSLSPLRSHKRRHNFIDPPPPLLRNLSLYSRYRRCKSTILTNLSDHTNIQPKLLRKPIAIVVMRSPIH